MRRALAGVRAWMSPAGAVGCCTSSYSSGAAARNRNAEDIEPDPAASRSVNRREPGSWLRRPGSLPDVRRRRLLDLTASPDTCRIDDRRIFTAAGMNAGGAGATINERIAHWRFEYASDDARREHRAVPLPPASCASTRCDSPVATYHHVPPTLPCSLSRHTRCSWTPASDADTAAGIVAACRLFDQSGRRACRPSASRPSSFAFGSELVADLVIGVSLRHVRAGHADRRMTDEDSAKVGTAVLETTAYIPWTLVFGHRDHHWRRLPRGAHRQANSLLPWPCHWHCRRGVQPDVGEPNVGAVEYLSLVITIPCSIYGAHLARKHIPPEA